MVFCRQKIHNKDISWWKSEIVNTRLYLIKLESIMRALSDALPTGHRAMANPTLQLHFDCGRATPPVSHSHNWPSGRMQKFFFKIGQKSYFLPIKTPKLILTIEWYYRSMYCRSNAMIFFKMANLKAISSSATLRLFCWHHHLCEGSLIVRYALKNLSFTFFLLRFVREILILSGRCQGNVREFWRSLLLWTLSLYDIFICPFDGDLRCLNTHVMSL